LLTLRRSCSRTRTSPTESGYLNARSTLLTLLGLGVIPVINENDTVTTEEIRVRRQRHAGRAGHQSHRGR
jgi:hypothetical protein